MQIISKDVLAELTDNAVEGLFGWSGVTDAATWQLVGLLNEHLSRTWDNMMPSSFAETADGWRGEFRISTTLSLKVDSMSSFTTSIDLNQIRRRGLSEGREAALALLMELIETHFANATRFEVLVTTVGR